ncbi:MAG: efflux RND transporter periplasmic adaptor subunit [Gammaproteobacteria bacterium]|nr:efflux RND transporter periplasmic adaptor subunit [Gammaproteobacteria bacterium]
MRNLSLKTTLLFSLLSCVFAPPLQAFEVGVTTVASLTQHPLHSAPATVVQDQFATISAEISGIITALSPRVGERIAADKLIATIDCRSYDNRHGQAELEKSRLEAELRFAQLQLQRAESLSTTISEEQRQQRQLSVQLLQLQLKANRFTISQAEIEQEKCRIRAPFTGTVIATLATKGELAAPGTPLLRLLGESDPEVEAQLRPDLAADLEHAAGITFTSQHEEREKVTLRSLLPQVGLLDRSRPARLSFAQRTVLTGSSGRIEWRGQERLLPASVIVRRDGVLGVMTPHEGKARFLPLPSAREGRPVVVSLQPEQQIIHQGMQQLEEGDPITISTPPASNL